MKILRHSKYKNTIAEVTCPRCDCCFLVKFEECRFALMPYMNCPECSRGIDIPFDKFHAAEDVDKSAETRVFRLSGSVRIRQDKKDKTEVQYRGATCNSISDVLSEIRKRINYTLGDYIDTNSMEADELRSEILLFMQRQLTKPENLQDGRVAVRTREFTFSNKNISFYFSVEDEKPKVC